MAWARVAMLSAALAGSACSYDWDSFDPRLSGTGGGATANVVASSSASGGAATTSTSVTGGMGGGPPILQTLDYIATVAECIDPTSMLPDPDACEAATGLNNLKVDLADAISGEPSYGYLRFDLDGTLAGREVIGVTLQLTTTDNSQAPGLSAGELWEVAPFTRPDLFVAAPQPVGNGAIAPDQGPIAANATVEYVVPIGLAQPDSGIFLALVPKSDDGVAYWNIEGLVPPLLRVDYR